jgi:hypothetical protein
MIVALLILFILATGALAYGAYNLTLQNEKLEEVVAFYQGKLDDIRDKVLETEIELKQLDIRGSFEADDEVGFVFKNIKDLSSDLTKTIKETYEYTD